jgi:hypothetical protein
MQNFLKFKGNQSFHFLHVLVKQGFHCQDLELSEVNFITPIIVVCGRCLAYNQKVFNDFSRFC